MNQPDDLDSRIDALIGGELTPDQREQLLQALAEDDTVRQQVTDHLRHRRSLRTAFGYDRAADDIAQHLPELQGRLQAQADMDQRRHNRRWWFGSALKVAAVVALVVSLTLAWQAHQSSQSLEQQLTQLKHQRRQPQMQLTSKEARRYRTLWKQVSTGVEPWMLVSGGDGQFGSLARNGANGSPSQVVAVEWRVENDNGQQVYEGTLLLPEGRRVSVDVAAEDNGFNQPLILSVHTGQPRLAGFWLKPGQGARIGVGGQTSTGDDNGHLGTFHHRSEPYHVYVQRHRLDRAGAAI